MGTSPCGPARSAGRVRAAVLVTALTCAALMLVAGCQSGSSSVESVQETPHSGLQGSHSTAANTPAYLPDGPVVTVPELDPGEREPAGGSSYLTTPETTPVQTVGTKEPAQKSSSASGGSPPGAKSEKPGTVDLSACAGCDGAIAAARDVVDNLSAVLVATDSSPVLLSVRPDGSIAGIINVVYGVRFPAQGQHALTCGSHGRCVVAGTQDNGNPLFSAFELADDGSWQDISGATGFPSRTSRGALVEAGSSGVGIAVQDSDGTRSVWMVFAWAGERYAVVGCAPDSASPPSIAALTLDACLA